MLLACTVNMLTIVLIKKAGLGHAKPHTMILPLSDQKLQLVHCCQPREHRHQNPTVLRRVEYQDMMIVQSNHCSIQLQTILQYPLSCNIICTALISKCLCATCNEVVSDVHTPWYARHGFDQGPAGRYHCTSRHLPATPRTHCRCMLHIPNCTMPTHIDNIIQESTSRPEAQALVSLIPCLHSSSLLAPAAIHNTPNSLLLASADHVWSYPSSVSSTASKR
jgi:hypothetical protein